MSGPEMTFGVHPRPVSDDPKALVEIHPPETTAEARSAPVTDIPEQDTFLSNLAFLVRYAFGIH